MSNAGDKPVVTQLPCPFCGTDEHLSFQWPGSMTADMPDRPCRVVCTHIDHDTVVGPTAYGKPAATAAWNTRHREQETLSREGREDGGLAIARDIVAADLADAKEHCDADWIGMSQQALDAIDAALSPPASEGRDVGRGDAHKMRSALLSIAEGNLGDAPWQGNYDAIRAVAKAALSTPHASPEQADANDL